MLNRKSCKNVWPHSKRFRWLTMKWKTVKHVTLAGVPWNIYSPTVAFFVLSHCFIGLYSVQLCLAASMYKSYPWQKENNRRQLADTECMWYRLARNFRDLWVCALRGSISPHCLGTNYRNHWRLDGHHHLLLPTMLRHKVTYYSVVTTLCLDSFYVQRLS